MTDLGLTDWSQWYRCGNCDAAGMKLWRPDGIVVDRFWNAVNQVRTVRVSRRDVRCGDCTIGVIQSEIWHGKPRLLATSAQLAVPAEVPSSPYSGGMVCWHYGAVPDHALAWWRALPSGIRRSLLSQFGPG